MDFNYRPLGYVMEILESAGLSVSYSYDDLVFAENNALIIQFNDEDAKQLLLYFNCDLDNDALIVIEKELNKAAQKMGFTLVSSGKYKIDQKEEGKEEISISFFPN